MPFDTTTQTESPKPSMGVGHAARNNRGRYTGQQLHLITLYWKGDEIIGAHPFCGVTQGQHAASLVEGKREADVTCAKCLKIVERRAEAGMTDVWAVA